jgi:hypothetical protein
VSYEAVSFERALLIWGSIQNREKAQPAFLNPRKVVTMNGREKARQY